MKGSNILITSLKRNSLDDGPGIRTTVFFKGCLLSCVWCQNPETKSPFQQIAYDAADCVGCAQCVQACSNKAVSIHQDGRYPVDRKKCRLTRGEQPTGEQLCGQCISACESHALRFAGTAYTVDELCGKLLKDEVFYRNSNGGVTFSGGEPTLHMAFLSELARKLKENNIHLCIETCGFYDGECFEKDILPYLDLVYFDIKIFNNENHRKYCGVNNDNILHNFEALFRSKKAEVLPRIPLIPGITTSRDNLFSIRSFLKHCGVKEIGLLPYNPMWLSKLPSINAASDYNHAEWMTGREKDEVKEIFRDFTFRDF